MEAKRRPDFGEGGGKREKAGLNGGVGNRFPLPLLFRNGPADRRFGWRIQGIFLKKIKCFFTFLSGQGRGCDPERPEQLPRAVRHRLGRGADLRLRHVPGGGGGPGDVPGRPGGAAGRGQAGGNRSAGRVSVRWVYTVYLNLNHFLALLCVFKLFMWEPYSFLFSKRRRKNDENKRAKLCIPLYLRGYEREIKHHVKYGLL